MAEHRDYYKILGISRTASSEEIKQAFRTLARRYHPDLHPNDPVAAERFREIREAYEVLVNDSQRQQYDASSPSASPQPEELNYQVYYVRGVEKILRRDHRGAIEEFTRAIALNSRYVEAFLRRIEAHLYLGNHRFVLEDCQKVLQIKPDSASAYFYRGRARHCLGYTQSAIQAYSQALQIEPDIPRSYYYRGIAFYELRDRAQAMQDLREAAQLYKEKGDRQGYRNAMEAINRYSWLPLGWGKHSSKAAIAAFRGSIQDFVGVLGRLGVNPFGGILPAFATLSQPQAAWFGLSFAVIFNACWIGGVYLGLLLGKIPAGVTLTPSAPLPILELGLVGAVPFLTLAGSTAICRAFGRRPGNWTGDIFLAGAVLLPVGVFLLAVSLTPLSFWPIASAFALSYVVLILYGGCTQIAHLSEAAATLAVPIILLSSGWLSYIACRTLLF